MQCEARRKRSGANDRHRSARHHDQRSQQEDHRPARGGAGDHAGRVLTLVVVTGQRGPAETPSMPPSRPAGSNSPPIIVVVPADRLGLRRASSGRHNCGPAATPVPVKRWCCGNLRSVVGACQQCGAALPAAGTLPAVPGGPGSAPERSLARDPPWQSWRDLGVITDATGCDDLLASRSGARAAGCTTGR